MEDVEKTGVRDFRFCEQRGSSVLPGRKRLREEECNSQDQKTAVRFILHGIWKSKMEIPDNTGSGRVHDRSAPVRSIPERGSTIGIVNRE